MTGLVAAREAYNVYRAHYSEYEAAAVSFTRRVETALTGRGARVEGRPKDPVSLFGKLRHKHYDAPLDGVPDLIGVRVIVPLRSGKADVHRALDECADLTVVEVEDQELTRPPHSLRYAGLHIHVTADDLVDFRGQLFRCEVQIRTEAEHAWSQTEHKFVYKGATQAADEARRVFARVLALVELYDLELVRGVEMISATEAFQRIKAAKQVGSEYAAIAGTARSDETAIELVELLCERGVLRSDEAGSLVAAYLADNRDQYERLVDTHGPKADRFDIARDWLLAEPAGLLVAALLQRDEWRLSHAVADTSWYEPIESLALALGKFGFIRSDS